MARVLLDKETRRSQLVQAAIRVFAKRGYNSAAISDIIQEAGVARGTFYLYFDSKLAVFRAVMRHSLKLFEEVVAREVARPYDNPLKVRERIRESLMDWLGFYNKNKDLAKIVFREGMAISPDFEKEYLKRLEACQRHWRSSIVRFQKLGFVRKDLDPEFMNLLFSGVMIYVVIRYIVPNPKPDIDRIVNQWLAFLEHGVRPKGWSLL